MISVHDAGAAGALRVLSRFRTEFYQCLTARAHTLFDLADAVLCTDGPIRTLVDLSLAPEMRRGHGALYDALACGRLDYARLRRSLSMLPVPRAADGRIVLAVDVSSWLRSDAATSPDRLSCRFTTGTIRVEPDRRHVTLPRLGTIRTHENTRKLHRRLAAGTARILSATVVF